MPGATRPYSAELRHRRGQHAAPARPARGTARSSQRRRSMSKSIVREQLEKSEMCSRPPVRFQMSQESTLPKSSSPCSARSRAPGTLSSIQLDLGAGKIGVDQQPRLVADIGPEPLGGQAVADGRRAPALPDDGVVDGPARCAVPDDGRLALVGDADGGDVRRARGRSFQTPPPARRTARTRMSIGSCSTQPGRGIYLRERPLRQRDDLPASR